MGLFDSLFGGGGGQQAAPTSQTISQTTIPDYAKPYVENMLGRAQALSETPYQAYQGERTAGFTPMQQQAFQGIQNLGPSEQLGTATNLAGAAGLGALNTGYRAGRFSAGQFTPMAAQQYMNPYIQAALAPQMELMNRQFGQQAAQNAAQATQAGAFGGSRFGIQQAQNQLNQNLATQNLLGQGYNTAYQQAAEQFNQDMARRMQAQQLGEQSRQFGAGLGLQGLQTGLQAASTLGNLGQTQFGQQTQALGMQQQAGATQQQQQQNILNQQYQDFLNQRQYPQQQLAFMSDMLRGLPLSQTTGTTYQAPPSMLSQVAGLGMAGAGAYGLYNKGFKKGGKVKAEKKAPAGLADLAVYKMA